MPDNIETIGATGADYSTPDAWITDYENVDHVTVGDRNIGEMIDATESVILVHLAGGSYTANATNHPMLRAASGNARDLIADTGCVWSNAGNVINGLGGGQLNFASWGDEDGLGRAFEAQATGDIASESIIEMQGTDQTCDSVYIRADANTTSNAMIQCFTARPHVRNVICIGADDGVTNINRFAFRFDNATDADLYNCDSWGMEDGGPGDGFFMGGAGVANCRNCRSSSSGGGTDFDGTPTTFDYCISEDTSSPAPGNNSFDSQAENTIYADPATDDFRPPTGSNAIGNGVDLSGTFTHDITGATRSTWDIGAYFVSVATGDISVLSSIYRHHTRAGRRT